VYLQLKLNNSQLGAWKICILPDLNPGPTAWEVHVMIHDNHYTGPFNFFESAEKLEPRSEGPFLYL
jgi:hypothetical protein